MRERDYEWTQGRRIFLAPQQEGLRCQLLVQDERHSIAREHPEQGLRDPNCSTRFSANKHSEHSNFEEKQLNYMEFRYQLFIFAAISSEPGLSGRNIFYHVRGLHDRYPWLSVLHNFSVVFNFLKAFSNGDERISFRASRGLSKRPSVRGAPSTIIRPLALEIRPSWTHIPWADWALRFQIAPSNCRSKSGTRQLWGRILQVYGVPVPPRCFCGLAQRIRNIRVRYLYHFCGLHGRYEYTFFVFFRLLSLCLNLIWFNIVLIFLRLWTRKCHF